ncbi:MFS transporter [Streptomyces cellulosae]|uniref:Major facilitator superfamily (MFS) profile domain-containing protein n=1 Tax=Streptomyces cellulosae TaxID=1968 RepID=A0ABW7YHZ9_STRCE
MVGAALLLMGGVTESTGWEHFIPGLVLGGIGAGLVNPPLASTAVGVVDFSRSGTASGVNGTFRQLGVSAGVAVLGSTFAVIIGDRFRGGLGGVPELAGRSDQLAALTRGGEIDQAVRLAPSSTRTRWSTSPRQDSWTGLLSLLTVSASLALVGGVLSLLLIRPADFQAAQAPKAPAADTPGQSPGAAES